MAAIESDLGWSRTFGMSSSLSISDDDSLSLGVERKGSSIRFMEVHPLGLKPPLVSKSRTQVERGGGRTLGGKRDLQKWSEVEHEPLGELAGRGMHL